MSSTSQKAEVYILKGHDAQRYNDFALNLHDLNFCFNLLNENMVTLLSLDKSNLKVAIWTSLLVKYFACFSNSASRRTLDAKAVFKGNDEAKAAFFRLQNVRNKNVVHDVNSSNQSNIVIEVIDNTVKSEFSSIMVVGGIGSGDLNNFGLLLPITIAFVERRQSELALRLQAQIGLMSLQEVRSLPIWTFDAAAAMFEVGEKRVRKD